MCLLSLSVESDAAWYSFDNGEGLFVETTHVRYPLKKPIPEWEIRSCRKQERDLIRNYEYMPNRLQQGAEIYKHHLEIKAKSQQ